MSNLILYHSTIEVKNFLVYFKVLFHGTRFDLSVILGILSPFLFLSFLSPLNRFKSFRNFWIYTPMIPLVYTILHLVGDFIYFQNAQKHLGYEGFVFFGSDFIVLLKSVFQGNTTTFIIGFLLALLSVFIIFKILNNFIYHEIVNLRKRIMIYLLWIIFTIIGIRGGFQKSFLSPSNAIVTENPLLNQFVLNGVYTTIQEMSSEKFFKIQEMNPYEAIALVREIIKYSGTEYVNDIYPIYRKVHYEKNNIQPDILLILLESWPTKYVLKNFNEKEITPNFNRLVKEGIYFSKFFANGGRTSNGLVSIITGIPDRPGKSMIHSKYSLNHFTPIGSLLKKNGYDTFFYYGGELAFENLTPVIQNWGFDNLFDAIQFDKTGKFKKGVWGYNDGDLFNKVLDDIKLQKSSHPKLRVCLTLSTHHPFQIPDESFNLFIPDEEENKFINSMHYADFALGKFIDEFKKLPEFKNTKIIIVSDHTSHRTLNYFEDRNIPFLVLNQPNRINEISERVSSQIDILPTILGMVGGDFYFSSLGRDIFHDNRKGYAYIAFGNIYGWAENNSLFMDTVEEFNGLHFTIFEPYISKGPCKENFNSCVEEHLKARAFLNITENLLKKNIIAPPSIIQP